MHSIGVYAIATIAMRKTLFEKDTKLSVFKLTIIEFYEIIPGKLCIILLKRSVTF